MFKILKIPKNFINQLYLQLFPKDFDVSFQSTYFIECLLLTASKLYSILFFTDCFYMGYNLMLLILSKYSMFHAFLFNIRNYSAEVINIQRREAGLNIKLPRVNNFNIKQKKAWNICFILCHQHQTRSGKIKTDKTQQISVKTQVFFVKTKLRYI